MIPRNINDIILDALSFSPVVLLTGARQTGKSTLAKWIAEKKNMQYISMDDFTILEAAGKDPTGFLAGLDGNVIIDEVQRAPKLLQAIKIEGDKNRRPGRFLLTGSANIFMIPKISESLAGRMILINLWPFSLDELQKKTSHFVDNLFLASYRSRDNSQLLFNDYIKQISLGGYPEIQTLKKEHRRVLWFKSYITTILEKDVREISKINGLYELPRLLTLIAARSGSLFNTASLSRDSGIPMMTLKRYLVLLETTFLIYRLPAWFSNINKRLIKAPKIFITDIGLLRYLLGIDQNLKQREPNFLGSVIETFVLLELLKQIGWSTIQPKIYYYHTSAGKEVDFILENNSGQIVGIEVKASSTIYQKDFKGLFDLKESIGKRFPKGIILSTGSNTIPFSKDLMTVPINALWNTGN